MGSMGKEINENGIFEHSEKVIESGVRGQPKISEGRDGQPKLTISRGDVPDWLVKAHESVESGRIEEAKSLLTEEHIEEVRGLVSEDSERSDVMFVLAKSLFQAGKLEESKYWYKRILERCKHSLVYNQLGNVCKHMGQLIEGLEYRRKAAELAPDNGEYIANLGTMLVSAGRTREGIEVIQQAIAVNPEKGQLHSCLLGHLHTLPNLDRGVLLKEHRRWASIHAPVRLAKKDHENGRNEERRLRIGYISPDFRTHSVTYFFESLLDGHNREDFEIFGYGSVSLTDATTERLKGKFDHYREVQYVDSERVANQIISDEIDILVDLAGHTAGNRLGVLAHKPAPIQFTYLGYPDSTGMEQVDYRFTDELADPAESQQYFSEELVYLPDGFLCYRPREDTGELSGPPVERKGYITFGSFNSNTKISPPLVAMWAEVLRVNGASKLLLKFNGGDEDEIREIYLQEFERLGIERGRIDIYGFKPPAEHFSLYEEVDIGLDTYPYNGTTTTCEALWMGVPVVSLVGKHHASRVGLSILSRVGLEYFTAENPREYVSKATALAENIEYLRKIRMSSRGRMMSCTLCDSVRFSRQVESAYRQVWRRWCQRPKEPAVQGAGQREAG